MFQISLVGGRSRLPGLFSLGALECITQRRVNCASTSMQRYDVIDLDTKVLRRFVLTGYIPVGLLYNVVKVVSVESVFVLLMAFSLQYDATLVQLLSIEII